MVPIQRDDEDSNDRCGAEEHHICPINRRFFANLILIHEFGYLHIQRVIVYITVRKDENDIIVCVIDFYESPSR